ncbi:MAG: NAD-dependent DNA ligase LigA [Defluviitaleaceae bacterium]|nr:NAD-dependent DNA ligase LigA [Defluviitaleaceae bacterium]
MAQISRMRELVKILNDANKAYYQQNREIMTDREYDHLYDELLELEKKTGTTLAASPTAHVGYNVLKTLKKVTHPSPLLSLDKTKEVDKLVAFLGEYNGVLSYKLDGLTILITYENGKMTRAVTRGNGTVGEDITHNALHFKNLPGTIPHKGRLVVRGEATISYTDFEEINENLPKEEKYKNPRNLCSGTVRQLDSSVLSKRSVAYFAFTLMESEHVFELKSQGLEFLLEQGFELVPYTISNAANIQTNVEGFKRGINVLNIPTDGLVLTYDNIRHSESLGATSKFPKDSLAFKWEDSLAKTRLVNIEWNTSRTGLINPLAVFEEVEIEGTVIKKAGLHNLSIVEELELGIGDEITVYKANMIIPQVAENLTRSGSAPPPTQCNICGESTRVFEQNGVKTLHCTNPNCKARQIKALTHYVSRNAMNIEGLSEATLTKFVEKGFITNFSDIYKLEEHSEKIKVMDGLGEKSLSNILASIEKSKTCTLPQFIYGLGIFNVGLAGAKLLCKHCNNNIEDIKKATTQELIEIDGFGDIIAESIVQYFTSQENQAIVHKALSYLQIESPKTKEETLKGLTFVITGSLENFKNRKELQEIIEDKSGKVTGSVTKNTSYLINNNKDDSSAKSKTAVKLGIPVITETEFVELMDKKEREGVFV